MPSHELTPSDAENAQEHSYSIELSEEELDQVSGGMSLYLNAVSFQESDTMMSHRASRRSKHHSGQTSFHAQHTKSSGFQLVILDASTEDLKYLGEFFGSLKGITDS